MNHVLTSSYGGYYTKKDVFGRSGDFITAPEISQIFGELIAINLMAKIAKRSTLIDRPLHIIEFGPGRGTMISDILRTFSSYPDFFKRVKKCSFIEVSPVLKNIQQNNIIKWGDTIDFAWSQQVDESKILKNEIPIFLAQEYFDAMPIYAFKNNGGNWAELKVANSVSTSSLCLIEEKNCLANLFRIPENFSSYKNCKTIEISPISWSICNMIQKILDKCDCGEGLIIDYGHFKPSENSLRAIHKHEFCSIFDNVGDADLSIDVDFQSLMHFLGAQNKYNFCTQRQFLFSMGINERISRLQKQLSKSESDILSKSVDRLINPSEMGSIYKVLQFSRN